MADASLERRLLLTSLLALLSALGIGGAALSYAFRQSAEAAFDERLRAGSDSLVASLAIDSTGTLALERPLGDPRFERAFSGWYWTAGAGGEPELVSRSLWDANLQIDSTGAGDAPAIGVRRATGPRDQSLRALVRSVTLPGGAAPIEVVMAGDEAELNRETERFDSLLLASLATLGVLLLAVLGMQIRLALRPIQALVGDLSAIREGTRDRVGTDVPRELQPLAKVVNELLEHDAALVERARAQVADLAHALKTPLSLVRVEAGEVADERGRRIAHHAETMRRHIERRLGGATPRAAVAGERIPVRPVLEGIVQTLARLHPTREIDVDVAEGLAFPGPREDLEEIAGNLLENACKWARRCARVRARARHGAIEISVDDDGAGVARGDREEMLVRGARLDLDVPGSGLGLGIVSDVVASYRGRLSLEDSDLGGLRAIVTLPS